MFEDKIDQCVTIILHMVPIKLTSGLSSGAEECLVVYPPSPSKGSTLSNSNKQLLYQHYFARACLHIDFQVTSPKHTLSQFHITNGGSCGVKTQASYKTSHKNINNYIALFVSMPFPSNYAKTNRRFVRERGLAMLCHFQWGDKGKRV